MGPRNGEQSARLLSDLQGVRVATWGGQLDDSADEDLVVDRHGGSQQAESRVVKKTEPALFPLKREVPIWRLMWDARPDWFRIMSCDDGGDQTMLETVVNVATSMPFVALGLNVPRTSPSTTVYANSLVGVGVASTMYHVSRGERRKFFRLGDYGMIALASLCLNSATRKKTSRVLMVSSALLVPVQPMLVTCLHAGMVEATFYKRVKKEPELRSAHNLHKLSTVLGGALFVADDIWPETSFIHAAWHLTAALGIATVSKLLT